MLGRLTSLRSLRGGLIATPAPLPASVLRAAAPARYMGSVFNSSRPIVILRSDQPAARAVMSQVLRRGLSTAANSAPKTDAAAGSAAETAEAKAEGKAEEAKQNEEAAEEEVYEDVPMEDEPLAAKWSRRIWTTIKVGLAGGVLFLIGYGLYTIIITLAPAGMGANAIMRKASEIVKHDPDLAMVFGEMKTYGEDFGGGSTEGRRYYVPEYEYEDDITGVKYHRVRFNLEGERGRKATVWAETRAGSSSDFRYIIVMNKEQTRVWSIVDHRPAELSLHDRQASVSSLMQDAGWTFFADNEGDALEQAEALGDYWLKVRTVRCDLDRDRCVREGITSRPAWGMGPAEGPGVFSSAWDLLSNSASSVYKTAFGSGSGPDATVSGSAASDVEALARAPERPVWKVAKGTKSLRELELMTRDLAAKKRRGGSDGIVGSASAALSGAVDSFKDLLGLGSTSSSGSSSSAK